VNSILADASGNSTNTCLSGMSYDVAGHVTGDTFGNGITEVFGYDQYRMQLTSQKAGTSSPLMAINNNSTINGTTESAAYTYDNLG
jgi:hypothetical protein